MATARYHEDIEPARWRVLGCFSCGAVPFRLVIKHPTAISCIAAVLEQCHFDWRSSVSPVSVFRFGLCGWWERVRKPQFLLRPGARAAICARPGCTSRDPRQVRVHEPRSVPGRGTNRGSCTRKRAANPTVGRVSPGRGSLRKRQRVHEPRSVPSRGTNRGSCTRNLVLFGATEC